MSVLLLIADVLNLNWTYNYAIAFHLYFLLILFTMIFFYKSATSVYLYLLFIMFFWGIFCLTFYYFNWLPILYLYFLLETIKVTNFYKDTIYLKKINNIIVFVLDHTFRVYSLYKKFKKIKKYFSQSFITFYIRILWRGKAYRVRFFKKYKKFTLNFGHSHWCKIIYPQDYEFVKLKRQNYLALFSKRIERWEVVNLFNNIRVFNKYTRRGIRVKNTPYIKRFGKISQVSSSMHSFG